MAVSNTMTIEAWKKMWDTDNIYFHKFEAHRMLEKHFSSFCLKGNGQKAFVPLCGKTLDMEWLSKQGFKVVGLEGVKKALEDFFKERCLECTEEDVPTMGPDCKVLQDTNKTFKLYYGDINLFNDSVESEFDFVWDRGSLVALNRCDVERYVTLMKKIVRPGGKIFLEAIEYDRANYEGLPRCPPAHPVFEDELRLLYEPEYSVQLIDTDTRMLLGKEAKLAYYLIEMNS